MQQPNVFFQQPIQQPPPPPQARTVYLQFNTRNQSFIDMYYFLKNKGVRNCGFMLILYDPELANINPHDPNLPFIWQQRVLRECLLNYWYFIREIVRVPTEGGSALGAPYKLHRGNLAYNFCALLNINTFLELPRQQGKTISACIRYLYLFNFGTTYSSMYFLNQNHDKSKENLQRVKNIRALLPIYLRFDRPMGSRGKMLKMTDTVEKLSHPSNSNLIKTVPSARNRINAGNLIRGKTVPLLWFDEYAFIPFNAEVYLNGAPAYKTAANNARANGKAYGILITTTPGDMTTEEGTDAYELKAYATVFSDNWYDYTYQQIMTIINANKKNNFVYIRYTYQQLGLSEQWFEELCADMRFNWALIRREVLLEWNMSSPNSPFTKEELEAVGRKVKEPIKTILVLDKYAFDIYEYPEYSGNMPKYPPIIGVDVAAGYQGDSSAITCIDSKTTRVFATFNNNSVSLDELPDIIYEIVSRYMPNAIINVERNGGYGLAVLSKLMKHSDIKRNLYYEIKDKVVEETYSGAHRTRKKTRTKVYGFNSTKEGRNLLIEILRWRMREHKDKFVAKRIYDELLGMEVKKNGFVEHSSKTHDDQIFSYLMAMYVWQEGINLSEWHIEKGSLKTDSDGVDEPVYGCDEQMTPIFEEINAREKMDAADPKDNPLKDLAKAKKSMGMMYHEWERAEQAKDMKALEEVLSTRPGREAYAAKYNLDPKDLENMNFQSTIPMSVFTDFYEDEDTKRMKEYKKNFNLLLMDNLDKR